jgi:phosphoribosylformylglycinamidine cyclo-ligase
MPLLFTWLKAQGNITDIEMYKTFNCGIGMAVIVAKEHVAKAKALLQENGETVFEIGTIRAQNAGEAPTIVI